VSERSERSERVERMVGAGGALPDQHVPDVVLEELLAMFGTPSPGDAGEVTYDFDDPSIDRLLGIDTVELRARPTVDDAEPLTDPAAPVAAPEPLAPAKTQPTITITSSAPSAAQGGSDSTVVLRPAPDVDGGDKPSRKARQAAKAGKAPKDGKDATSGAKDGKDAKADATSTGATVDAATAGSAGSAGPRVIVIADDDQHIDPIYLDEDAEHRMREIHTPVPGPGGRSTIVIDEFDQHGDAIQALASSSSAIDPRLRARRVAVRRAVGRRRLLWTAIVAAIVLVAVAVVAVLASPIFDVRTIQTQGNVYTDPALVQSVEKQLRGTPILLVDTKKYERELEASPWIEAARVTTSFPHHVLIDIRERVPEATFAGSDGQFRVIDRDGRVLAVLGGRPIAYMLLTGTAPDSEPGQFAGDAYAAAAQLVIALPPEIRSITTSVGVDTTTNELSLALDAPNAKGVEVRLGTVAGIEDKLARLLKFVQDGLKPDQQLDVATSEVGT
jgi:cell division protein FtsQ